jgi:hypothetical protein
MPPRFIRDAELYVDEQDHSEIVEAMRRIAREDERGIRTIRKKIDLLRQTSFEDALRSRLIKKPSATIYVLRVQSGPVAYRLPFFEPLCWWRKLVVFTHCVQRSELRGDGYRKLLEEAETRRLDWIERNCPEG